MSSRFRAASKYKHSLGADDKRENWWLDVTPSTYGDDNPLAASAKWIAVSWNSSAGGPVALLPLSSPGKVKDPSMLQGHSKRVSVLEFDPFNDYRLATGSEDNTVQIWNIPQTLSGNITESQVSLKGHSNKLTSLKWHPSAGGVIATGSTDKTVRVWDVDGGGAEKLNVGIAGMLFGLDWNYNGSLIVTTAADKKIRVLDPRNNKVAQEGNGHEGVKPSLVAWLGNSTRFITTGFSKMRERQICIWDSTKLSSPLRTSTIDSSTGVIVPLYDADTQQLYLAGKGDTTLRVFEVSDTELVAGNNVVSKVIQKGATRVPKRALDIMGCEVNRIIRVSDNEVVPCSFVVPRKVRRDFQEDLFPPSPSTTPAHTAASWLGGDDKDPILASLDPAVTGVSSGSSSSSSSSSTSSGSSSSSSSSTSAFDAAAAKATGPAGSTTTTASYSPSSSGSSRVGGSSSTSSPGSVRGASSTSTDEYYVPKKLNIVRSSKYRNILTKPTQQSQWFTNLKVKTTGMEGNPLQANSTYFGVPWVGSGGQLAIIPLKASGKMPDSIGTIETGSDVMCFAFHPANDKQVVTGLDNGKIRFWDIPDDLYLRPRNFTEWKAELSGGHSRRLSDLSYHPLSHEVMLTTGMDLLMKLWDLQSLSEKITMSGHTEQIQSTAWNYNGSVLASSCKDMRLRLWDPRQSKQTAEAKNHEAPKASRLAWLGNSDKLFSVGFNKLSNREFLVWDTKNLSQPIVTQTIDLGNGVYEPFYDEDMALMQLVAMGDTSIKYYEFGEEGGVYSSYYLTDNKLGTPTLGIARLPKASLNVAEVEVGQFVKIAPTGNAQTVERFSVKVPRTKMEFFQDDIYAPTRTRESVLSAGEWFGGRDAVPKLASLRPAGMPLLSEAPKVERVVKRFNPDDVQQDAQDLKNAVVNRFFEQMMGHKEGSDTVAPQNQNDGVAEDEWSD